MTMNLAKQITDRLSKLKSARQPHEPAWRECFEYSFPVRANGFTNNNSAISTADNVQRKKSRLMDTTLTDAARTQASAIVSGLTPANARWFGLDVDSASDEERRWLDEAANTIWRNIHNANFDSAAYEGMLDLMACGWFALYVDTDRDKGGFSFQLWPVSSVYCDSTRADGRIDKYASPDDKVKIDEIGNNPGIMDTNNDTSDSIDNALRMQIEVFFSNFKKELKNGDYEKQKIVVS